MQSKAKERKAKIHSDFYIKRKGMLRRVKEVGTQQKAHTTYVHGCWLLIAKRKREAVQHTTSKLLFSRIDRLYCVASGSFLLFSRLCTMYNVTGLRRNLAYFSVSVRGLSFFLPITCSTHSASGSGSWPLFPVVHSLTRSFSLYIFSSLQSLFYWVYIINSCLFVPCSTLYTHKCMSILETICLCILAVQTAKLNSTQSNASMQKGVLLLSVCQK